jgi:hypothetical protein
VAQEKRKDAMLEHNTSQPAALNLKAGEWVEVRSKEEISATLDGSGCLENLPFMPEMLQYCGQRFQVFKNAHKTCDYIQGWSIRRMKDSVHLAGLRCDGSGHDGCQASCLIFWKEAWLKRVENDVVTARTLRGAQTDLASTAMVCTEKSILAGTHRQNSEGETVYRCQVTDVPKFTSHMSFWDPRQYIRDLRSRNLAIDLGGGSREERVLETTLTVLRMLQASLVGFFNEIQKRRHKSHYPFIFGTSTNTTSDPLNLQPGDLVEVRSKEEIMATLDKGQKNRGLWFDSEMLPYCGGIYRVLRRVHRIIDETSGKMVTMKHPCIVLEGVVCKSEFHRLCPRAIYPYWRESWLKRANIVVTPLSMEQVVGSCNNS